MGPREKLTKAANLLRKQAARILELESNLKDRDKLDEAEKIAMDMEAKGVLSKEEIKPTAKKWLEDGRDLETLREAVKIAEKLPEPMWAGTMETSHGSSRPEDRVINFLTKYE